MKRFLVGLAGVATGLAIWWLVFFSPTEAEPVDACDPSRLPQALAPFNAQLQAFDDTSLIALNVPRDMLVEPTLRLQEIRREVVSLTAPDCLLSLRAYMLDYMDSLVNVLLNFIGGAGPAQAQAGLELADPKRIALEAELGRLLGATLTPYPTALAAGSIPVTGAATPPATPQLSPTSTGVIGMVQSADGANLRHGPSLEADFTYVLAPGLVVELTGISADGLWLRVAVGDLEQATGWVFGTLLSVDGDLSNLPVINP